MTMLRFALAMSASLIPFLPLLSDSPVSMSHLTPADEAKLAGILGGGGGGPMTGPCNFWKTCTTVYAENDRCGVTWTQPTPCPLKRNCPPPGQKCDDDQDKEIKLYQCMNEDEDDCEYTVKDCGKVNRGECPVSEIFWNGEYQCTGGTCAPAPAGSPKLDCPDWNSCR